jgi:hypothetical protein
MQIYKLFKQLLADKYKFMLQGIGIFMGNANYLAYDSDAQSFITAAGITDATQKFAIDKLVKSAKTNGWWSKCKAIYPFVGGTASTHKWNLKDPRDLDASFRISFNGTWTHNSNGIQGTNNDNSSYADSFFIPSNEIGLNDSHVSVYIITPPSSFTTYSLVTESDDSQLLSGRILNLRITNLGWASALYYSGGVSGNSTRIGNMLSSRNAVNTQVMSLNGTIINTANLTPVALPTKKVFINSRNNYSAIRGCDSVMAFFTIGYGIPNSIQSSMYTDIQTFQTLLGRQV